MVVRFAPLPLLTGVIIVRGSPSQFRRQQKPCNTGSVILLIPVSGGIIGRLQPGWLRQNSAGRGTQSPTEKLEAWRKRYNEERPHGAIGRTALILLHQSSIAAMQERRPSVVLTSSKLWRVIAFLTKSSALVQASAAPSGNRANVHITCLFINT
ncbi:MAG: hypothetical protein EOP50_20480 [Sphingobacteriales bacterium]|nr:MAG: hypothetical protein EOP50_20480 [Sphingobacteriales bacterium]